MNESLVNDSRTMGKHVAVLTVVCLMLCLSFNYTFPLQRDTTKDPLDNHSREHIQGIVDRTKKMAANLELALKKFIDSTPNKAKEKCSHSKHGVVDNDLSNYEQLVIMKKYPFLDLQELDFNIGQLNKNSRQNLNPAQILTAPDSSFCEQPEEGPSVEITNRGLSGFALPAKPKPQAKENPSEVKEVKDYAQTGNAKDIKDNMASTTEPSDNAHLVRSLANEIKTFEEHHHMG